MVVDAGLMSAWTHRSTVRIGLSYICTHATSVLPTHLSVQLQHALSTIRLVESLCTPLHVSRQQSTFKQGGHQSKEDIKGQQLFSPVVSEHDVELNIQNSN